MSRDVQVPAHELEAWRLVFLEAGITGLKARGDPEARAVKQAQANVGELAKRLELAEMLLERGGTGGGDEVDEVAGRLSGATGRRYPVTMICRQWRVARSTLYLRRFSETGREKRRTQWPVDARS